MRDVFDDPVFTFALGVAAGICLAALIVFFFPR